MKIKSLLFLHMLVLLSSNVFAQKNPFFKTDTSYNNYYEPFLLKLDEEERSNVDLRIRLWFSNGFSRVNIFTTISLSKNNDLWNGNYYTLSKRNSAPDSSMKVTKYKLQNINLDSVYEKLNKEGLLTQNSQELGSLIENKRPNDVVVWTDGGPTVYYIEIITRDRKWTLRYPCPKYFLEEYKINEFEHPLNILTILLQLIGRSPC